MQEFMTVAQGQMADNGEARLGAQLCQILRPFYRCRCRSLRAVFYENVFTCVLWFNSHGNQKFRCVLLVTSSCREETETQG